MATAWAERPGDFQMIGPGGGGAMFNPTISPHDTNTVLISCDMTGSYITHDGGRPGACSICAAWWISSSLIPTIRKPCMPHATGLWRSTDGGEHWNLVYPKPSTVKGVKMASDHSDEDILADPDPLGDISALAIDPADSKMLYAAAGAKDQPASLSLTIRWSTGNKLTDLPESPRRLWIDPKSSAGVADLYRGSDMSLLCSLRGKCRQAAAARDTNDLSLGSEAQHSP